MASLSSVLLECLVPLLVQDAPASAPQKQPDPPWVIVDWPLSDQHTSVEGLQLVVLSDGTYVGSYQLTGHAVNLGTSLVRSRDHGVTWTRIAMFEDLHSVSLIEHDDVVWLVGIQGESPSYPGPVVVKCLSDSAGRWQGGTSVVRRAESYGWALDTVQHAGRVWRSFSRGLGEHDLDLRSQAFVASAPLGWNLQDPASWRWSGEMASDGWQTMHLVPAPSGDPTLLSFDGRGTLSGLADLTENGGLLTPRAEVPGWTLPPRQASCLVRDPIDGRIHALCTDSGTDAHLLDNAPRNALAVVSSTDLLTWTSRTLLHHAERRPLRYGYAAALIEGEDLAALISYEQPPTAKEGEPRIPLTIAFLRAPKFRERSVDAPPMWGPPIPR